MCASLKKWPSLGVKIKYELAVKKLKSYSDCIPNNKGNLHFSLEDCHLSFC